jgi:hypothetical protein
VLAAAVRQEVGPLSLVQVVLRPQPGPVEARVQPPHPRRSALFRSTCILQVSFVATNQVDEKLVPIESVARSITHEPNGVAGGLRKSWENHFSKQTLKAILTLKEYFFLRSCDRTLYIKKEEEGTSSKPGRTSWYYMFNSSDLNTKFAWHRYSLSSQTTPTTCADRLRLLLNTR